MIGRINRIRRGTSTCPVQAEAQGAWQAARQWRPDHCGPFHTQRRGRRSADSLAGMIFRCLQWCPKVAPARSREAIPAGLRSDGGAREER